MQFFASAQVVSVRPEHAVFFKCPSRVRPSRTCSFLQVSKSCPSVQNMQFFQVPKNPRCACAPRVNKCEETGDIARKTMTNTSWSECGRANTVPFHSACIQRCNFNMFRTVFFLYYSALCIIMHFTWAGNVTRSAMNNNENT